MTASPAVTTKSRQPDAAIPDRFAQRVHTAPIDEELGDAFMPYALSVLESRAIPDVRDGLKPVQRRILWAMRQLRLTSTAAYYKSAGIVGETMGQYHPHGDSAVYDSMVRMAQPFAAQMPMIDGKGNFGSLDDPPAAYRYTEARLTIAAERMLHSIDMNTVDMADTYDSVRREPVVLPAGLPNLLVNGVSGIAVGMRTLISPHNLSEIVDAVHLVLNSDKPIPVEELMSVVKGPDFPSGGVVVDSGGLADAYATGQGQIVVRGVAHIEPITQRQRIVVTELPHMVGAEQMVAAVQKAISKGVITRVADVTDLSDRQSGLRIAVDVKKGADPRQVIEQLWRHTPLQQTVTLNHTALTADGQPQTMSLWQMLHAYAEHRRQVTVRQAKHTLRQARRDLSETAATLAAVRRIDEVINTIRDPAHRTARQVSTALTKLLNVTHAQAGHVMAMPLSRLRRIEHERLVAKHHKLEQVIADRADLIASPQRQRSETAKQLTADCQGLTRKRRTRIVTT